MNEQEQFEEWFANDTKGLDKASARAGWAERMANESAEIAQLREELAEANADFVRIANEREELKKSLTTAEMERDELRQKLKATEACLQVSSQQREFWMKQACELLALIHRDGGYHPFEHGPHKSFDDAKTAILADRTELNELRAKLAAYESQARARIAMPERMTESGSDSPPAILHFDIGWNAALYEVARLNAVQQEGGDHD